ncbi:unnamed protein product, partial [Allacma fusca]
MFKFLQFHENTNIAKEEEEYLLVGDSLTAKRANELLEEKTFDIPFGTDHALVHLGLQESIFKKFDSSMFQNELNKLVSKLRDYYQIPNIVLALIPPINFPTPTKDYWDVLEEINKTIYFTTRNQEKCLFWNAFSPFVKRNELVPSENKWFKYVAEGKILYEPKGELYDIGKSSSKLPGYAKWKYYELSKLHYEMCSFFKKYCKVNLFPKRDKESKERDNLLDGTYGKSDQPVSFNLNDSIIDVLNPIEIEYKNKDVSPKITVQFGKIDVDALLDNGCSHVLMNENVFERIVAEYPELRKSEVRAEGMGQKFSLAATKSHPKINKMAYVPMSFPCQKPQKGVYNIQVFVVKDLNTPLIIGRNLMSEFEMVIHTAGNYVEVTDPNVT